jgi:hypothetical protein
MAALEDETHRFAGNLTDKTGAIRSEIHKKECFEARLYSFGTAQIQVTSKISGSTALLVINGPIEELYTHSFE